MRRSCSIREKFQALRSVSGLRQVRQSGFTHQRVGAINHILGTGPNHLVEVIMRQDIHPIGSNSIKNDIRNLWRLHTLAEDLLKNGDALFVFGRPW